jgi:hypothetical protein
MPTRKSSQVEKSKSIPLDSFSDFINYVETHTDVKSSKATQVENAHGRQVISISWCPLQLILPTTQSSNELNQLMFQKSFENDRTFGDSFKCFIFTVKRKANDESLGCSLYLTTQNSKHVVPHVVPHVWHNDSNFQESKKLLSLSGDYISHGSISGVTIKYNNTTIEGITLSYILHTEIKYSLYDFMQTYLNKCEATEIYHNIPFSIEKILMPIKLELFSILKLYCLHMHLKKNTYPIFSTPYITTKNRILHVSVHFYPYVSEFGKKTKSSWDINSKIDDIISAFIGDLILFCQLDQPLRGRPWNLEKRHYTFAR